MQNHVDFTGRLTKPTRTGNVEGTEVINFTIACDFEMAPRKATVDGKEQIVYMPSTAFIDCAAWGREATDIVKSLEKGDEVEIHIETLGAKHSKSQEGKDYANLTARVSNVRLLAKSGVKPSTNGHSNGHVEDESDAIPF